MVHGEAWRDAAAALRAARGAAEIGLHLDLTEPFGERRFRLPWPRLVVDALAGRLDGRALADEIAAQLDGFERAVGQAPDFVDGHRHVHQLPSVRERLVAELVRRYPSHHRPWLRRTVPRQAWRGGLKPWVIAALGSSGLDALAERHQLQTNRCLLGVYGFGDGEDAYRRRLRGWLDAAADGDLLVCHPAGMARAGDPIGEARVVEHRVLTSPEFSQALVAAGIEVARIRKMQ